ncbi:MAG TPA: hypothetical protein VMP08_26185 [Anaerolineae bacterium]|nr:hypothetical protein [Anaerolineae bacterium]
MSTTNNVQRGGDDAKQIGVVEGNVTISGRARGLGAWGCFAIGAVAVVIVAVTVVIVAGQLLNHTIDTTMQAPAQISNSYQPDVASISTEKIALPQSPGISPQEEQAVAALIVEADIAEIKALWYEDDSYLNQVYAGNALQTIQEYIGTLQQNGVRQLSLIDLNKSYYTDMRFVGNNVLAVDECEYWSDTYYDPTTGKELSQTDWQLVPQTINIEAMGNNLYITSISFYSTNAFCTK